MYDLKIIKKICAKITEKDRSIKKSDLKNIKITDMFYLDGNLYLSILIMKGTVLVYSKQLKYLLEDSCDLLNTISHKKEEKRKKEIQQVPVEDVYISDIVINNEINDFTIESMREEDTTRNIESTLIESFKMEIENKRRKIMEDEVIEYDNNYYKRNICNINNILDRRNKINELLNYQIGSFFNDKLRFQGEIEMMRDQTSVEVFNEMSYNEELPEYVSEISVEEYVNKLDTSLLPSKFEFNSFVSGFSREEQARHFFDLLNHVSKGKIEVEQKDASSTITCTVL